MASLATMRLIWGTFINTQVLLAAGCYFAIGERPPSEIALPVHAALPLAALGLAAATPLVRARVMAPAGAPASPPAARYQTALIVGLALAEGVTLLGFGHAILAHRFVLILPYLALSLLLMFPQAPTEAGLAAAARP